MTRILNSVLAIAALAVMAVDGNAAVISVQPSISGYFDAAFNPIPAPRPRRLGTDNTHMPTVVAVDIHMTVVSLDPGEDSFGLTAFTIKHGYPAGLGEIHPNLDAGGYFAYPYPPVDVNGPVNPPGAITPLFAQNGDIGESFVDLVGILVHVAPGAFVNAADPRRNVGEPTGATLPSGDSLKGPMLLGIAYLTWNGQGRVDITLEGPLRGTPPQVAAKRTDGTYDIGTAPPAANLIIGYNFPEPSSLVLLGGCLGGVALRRNNVRTS